MLYSRNRRSVNSKTTHCRNMGPKKLSPQKGYCIVLLSNHSSDDGFPSPIQSTIDTALLHGTIHISICTKSTVTKNDCVPHNIYMPIKTCGKRTSQMYPTKSTPWSTTERNGSILLAVKTKAIIADGTLSENNEILLPLFPPRLMRAEHIPKRVQ